jgi:hypothetical protein
LHLAVLAPALILMGCNTTGTMTGRNAGDPTGIAPSSQGISQEVPSDSTADFNPVGDGD